MAKWGEGDPRWIVEERPDATNVNNWHWTEKNASEWSKGKIHSLYKNLTFEEPGLGTITITDVSKCEGESTANNRKGKLIFFYEWNVELDWSADPDIPSENEEEIKGKIEITNFSEENLPHEIDINVSVLKSGSLGNKFKEFIRLKGIVYIRDKVALYIEALKEEFGSDLLLPTKNQVQASTKYSKTMISQDLAANIKNIKVCGPGDSKIVDTSFTTTTINLSHEFKCTADEMYKILTVQEMLAAFTRCEAKVNAEKGGKFELFSGNIIGEFVELSPHERIVQKWRFRTWPDNHFSNVTLTISQGEDATMVHLCQSGIPINDLDRTRLGWQNYYWDSIKRTFGFGATLI